MPATTKKTRAAKVKTKLSASAANVDLESQKRIVALFQHRVNTGLRTSGAKHAMMPVDCMSSDTDCNVTQTQAKNDYSLDKEEMDLMKVRQNKKRRFYCGAQLDAVCINKFGFEKFLRKKFRDSAGVKTAAKNLAALRKLEAEAKGDEAVFAAKNAITFLRVKVEGLQSALDQATKQFAQDFPAEAASFVPKPKSNAKELKLKVKEAVTSLKQKHKAQIAKLKATKKARPAKRKAASTKKTTKKKPKKTGAKGKRKKAATTVTAKATTAVPAR